MHFKYERVLDEEIIERDFTLGDIPGYLWTAASATATNPASVILLGHPRSQDRLYPRLLARAMTAARSGFAAVTIELPGSGRRPPLPEVDDARRELREAVHGGLRPTPDVIDRLILPLTDEAVPEWQRTLDALLSLPEISGPVGYSGGVISIGVRLAVAEPRIVAASLFAGSFIP